MDIKLKTVILISLALMVGLAACESPAKRAERARTLYNEGVDLRQQRLSEEAAERFLQALDYLGKDVKDEKKLLLEGQL